MTVTNDATAESAAQSRRRNWKRIVIALAVCLLVVLAVGYWQRDKIIRVVGPWFGMPPQVDSEETYAGQTGSETFDHSEFDALLRAHVDDAGLVDYSGLRAESKQLDGYIKSLASAPFEKLGRDEKLALLINAYNAFTLKLILDHEGIDSIQDIPSSDRWEAERWKLAGRSVSLNEIEHEMIRPHFVEPRIHFALVCAAVGCPPLRNDAYTGERLEVQLKDQAEYVHTHDRWFRYDRDANTVYLTELYNWYAGDFESVAGSVVQYAARYSPALQADLKDGVQPEVKWIEYDWSLNAQ